MFGLGIYCLVSYFGMFFWLKRKDVSSDLDRGMMFLFAPLSCAIFLFFYFCEFIGKNVIRGV